MLAEARDLGFLGPGPVEAQREHATAFVAPLSDRPPGLGVDLGTGGGIPGLVVATALPSWRWELVETGARRAAFLERAVDALDLADRVRVRQLRAEDLGRTPGERARADAVTARSFGPPAVTAECAAPLLRAGGALVVSEPPGGRSDRWDEAGLAHLGLGAPEQRPGPPAPGRPGAGHALSGPLPPEGRPPGQAPALVTFHVEQGPRRAPVPRGTRVVPPLGARPGQDGGP